MQLEAIQEYLHLEQKLCTLSYAITERLFFQK